MNTDIDIRLKLSTLFFYFIVYFTILVIHCEQIQWDKGTTLMIAPGILVDVAHTL